MARARIASVEALTNAIMRDRQRERPTPTKTTAECFACGREYLYRDTDGDDSGRFCSTRCREAYDAGFPAHASKGSQHWHSLPMGKHGFLIKCRGCERQFDSKGLRCCSVECERAYRLKEEVAEHPFRFVKRKCVECSGEIPNWRKGRRVSKATRFCSDRCAERSRRKMGSGRLAA
jgi:hypothetical protein